MARVIAIRTIITHPKTHKVVKTVHEHSHYAYLALATIFDSGLIRYGAGAMLISSIAMRIIGEKE